MLAATFVLYGFWVMTFFGKWDNVYNVSLFPLLVPLGAYMIWRKEKRLAMASSLFFAPYHSMYSLMVPLTALLQYPKLLAVAWAASWLYVVLKFFV
jgi:hypothetical protein